MAYWKWLLIVLLFYNCLCRDCYAEDAPSSVKLSASVLHTDDVKNTDGKSEEHKNVSTDVKGYVYRHDSGLGVPAPNWGPHD